MASFVAPHEGAWIETDGVSDGQSRLGSPLTKGRGLKHGLSLLSACGILVAPHEGAWIETLMLVGGISHISVSPLTKGRGLKLWHLNARRNAIWSPLTKGRGLKQTE